MQRTRHTKKKVPIIAAAISFFTGGTELISHGEYVEGLLLMAVGGACVIAYEYYQVKELPEGVSDDMVKTIVDKVADMIVPDEPQPPERPHKPPRDDEGESEGDSAEPPEDVPQARAFGEGGFGEQDFGGEREVTPDLDPHGESKQDIYDSHSPAEFRFNNAKK